MSKEDNNNPQIIQANLGEKVLIPVAEFAAKYKSKRECYNFLAVDCDVYLPAYGTWICRHLPIIISSLAIFLNIECVTIYFLKDLVYGKKKRIYGKEVRHIAIPQYENLTIEKIAEFVAPYHTIHHYLPDEKEIPKVPKQWLANVCNSVLKDVFKGWVKDQVTARNKTLAIEKGMMIECDPEIAQFFHASTKVSGKLSTFLVTMIFSYSLAWNGCAYAKAWFKKEKN